MKIRESKTDLGAVLIHKKVIASIAALAAIEIDGVKCVEKGLKSSIYELLGKKNYGKIRVDIDRNDEVKLEIPIVVKYGYNLPEIGNKVQENVRIALEKMTDLLIKEINVVVQGIERS